MTIVSVIKLRFGFESGHLNVQEPNIIMDYAVLQFGGKRTKVFGFFSLDWVRV